MKACRRFEKVGWTLLIGGASVLATGFGALPAADPPTEESPVTFSMSQAPARAGETVTLVFSLKTQAALRSISVAVDFEESRVRVQDVRRALNTSLGSPSVPPSDVASTSINNTDQEAGNQTREGWLHLEIDVQGQNAELPIERNIDVPILEIDFVVLPGALPGFSPVVFETVGPVDALPSAYLVNRVEIAGAIDVAKDVPVAAMSGGGIDIIGEVGFFMRGDSNFDRLLDISDPVVSLSYLFLGGQTVPCLESCDANDDGRVDISDPIFTLRRLYEAGGPIPEPSKWGPDPTPDELGCAIYPGH